MGLRPYLDRVTSGEYALVIANRTAPDPIKRMLHDLFDRQPVSVADIDLPDAADNVVLLLADDAVIATSPLDELLDAILLINSDLFRTGARSLPSVSLPSVLAELTDTRFRLRGYPESNREKLLLILISRHIERLAWEADSGTIRSSFQNLERLNDEVGTRQVYDRLDRSGTAVHVYGQPGWTPPAGSTITAHVGHAEMLRESWFVIYCPESDGADQDPIGLVAVEESTNEWLGFWSRDTTLVREVNREIERQC